MDEPPAETFDVPALEAARAELQERTGELYLEFLRRDSLSCGLYVLEPGATDPRHRTRRTRSTWCWPAGPG